VAEAMSGVYQWARQPGQRPVINPVGGLGDIGSGMFLVVGILAALLQRQSTGQGQHVDVAMFDAMVAIADVVPSLASLGATDRIPGAIVTTFEAADGDVVVQVSREHQFERLARTVGHPEWIDDERFATRQGWIDYLDSDIRPAVEGWSRNLRKLAVCETLAAAGIPCGPCNTPEEVLADEHLAQHGMLVQFDRGDGATYAVPASPVHLSRMAAIPDHRSPWLGEHTDAVLTQVLGFEAPGIKELRDAGIVA
jgi:crotonobetainyl-CoA:carnitine CoA-transferase CaiB-like acyl-CoA transferase